MKILVLTDDFPPHVLGGAGVMAHRLSKELVAQGHVVRVLSTVSDKKHAGTHMIDGMQVDFVHSHYHPRWRSYVSLFNPFLFFKVRRAIKEYQPDIVHAHNIHYNISYASLLISKNTFLTCHDIMPFYPGSFTEFIKTGTYTVDEKMLKEKFGKRYNPFRNKYIRTVLNKIKVIAVSNELKTALEANGIKNVSVVHNGIDVSEWSVSNTYGTGRILFQGRLSGVKGADVLLQALQKVPQATLVVAGIKDSYAEKMLEKSRSLGIENRIVFTGWLSEEEMKQEYKKADLIVIPSLCFDSFPNGNLEGFASGKPVVSTIYGGSKEVVVDGVNGYIVTPTDIEVLAQKIILLLDPIRAKAFGFAGRDRVCKEFTALKMATGYLLQFGKNEGSGSL